MSRKAKQMIDTMIANGTVSAKAVDWLTTATDPFHDTAVDAAGYPDINTVSTLTQCFTYTASLGSPTPTTNAAWDAHVFFAPYAPDIYAASEYRLEMTTFRAQNQTIQDATINPQCSIGPGYNAFAVAPGQAWWQSPISAPSVELDAMIQSGCYRVIAAGVEVVNTTSELYKSGSVTYYRTPSQSTITTPVSQTQQWQVTCATWALPPYTQNQAQLYPTSRTLPAAEGYYGVATLNSDPAFQTANGINILALQAPDLQDIDGGGSQVAFISQGIAGYPNGTVPPKCGTGRVLPFDVHGAIFAGLAAQTTLQVTTRYYVERIPASNDANLLVLARPPTPYDPTVLEIYSRVLSQLPVGCTVKENPLGEWFNDVLEAVATYAPAVGAAFGGLGPAFGAGISAGANQWLKSRQTSTKPTQQVLGQKSSVPKKRKTAGRRRPKKQGPRKPPPKQN